MNKFMAYVAMVSLTFSLAVRPVLAVDHSTSNGVGHEAEEAGREFVDGASKVAEVFEVTAKIVVGGTTWVILKGLQGSVWVAEESVAGVKYLAQGAKVIIIKTARGIQWVAVKALEAGEIILDGVEDAARLVIENVTYVLIKMEEGVTYVAQKVAQAGRAVIRGVQYVAVKTRDGIIFLSQQTWNALKAGYQWTVEQTIRLNIRTRLASAMAFRTGIPAGTTEFFKAQSTSPRNSTGLKRLATASLNACTAFTRAYATNP